MSVQITVRLPENAVSFLDQEVERSGQSREAVLSKLLRRAARRQRAERDAAIYATQGEDPDLASFAAWARQNAARVWADLD